MLKLRAMDALNDSVPVFGADSYPADLSGRERSSRTTHVAVVDDMEKGRFLGLLDLDDLLKRRPGEELFFRDLVKSKATLRVSPQTSLWEVVVRLNEHNQDAAAVVDEDGNYLGAVTIDEARRWLEARRTELLADSERCFRSIFEQAAVGVAQVAPDGRWMEINRRMCDIVGFTRKELLATTFQSMTHPEDRDVELGYMRRAIAGETGTYSTEKRCRRKDGSFIWTNSTLSLVREAGDEGTPLYFILVIEDIDARKRAEATAAESAASLKLAVAASKIGLWDWDLSTNTIRMSREWKSQLGYAEREIADEFGVWERFIHPEDLEIKMAQIERCLAEPTLPYECEFRMRHRDGSWRWINSRAEIIRDAGGKPTRMLGCHMDVTESKRLTQVARTSEAFLRAAIDALPACTAVIDESGKIINVNRRWREFAADNGGRNRNVFEGANYLAICDSAAIHCADAGTIAGSLRSVLTGGPDPVPLEYACHSATAQRWFQAWVHGFNQGSDRFAMITHQDVTAVRLAANRETVATIAAGVAHEFNSLLCAAAMQLHRHIKNMPSAADTDASKAAEVIRQAQSLASALLNLYEGTEGNRKDPISLYPWLSETVTRLATTLPPGIHVSTEVEFDLPEVLGHALGLEQVVRNLLINAANVLGDRGEIRVCAKLATGNDQPMVEVRVSDDGPGIPEALRTRVFEPGFSTNSRSYRSGLGLAIAARLLEQFGGSISFEPNTPRGSTFVIRLLTFKEETL